jgi:hypothetical protein
LQENPDAAANSTADDRNRKRVQGELLECEELTTPIELANSKQGRHHLVIMNGFIYFFVQAKGSKISWKCKFRGCIGRVMTYLDYEQSLVGALRREHSHLPDPIEVEKCRMADKINAKFGELQGRGLEEKTMREEMVQFVKELTDLQPPEVQIALPKQHATIRRLFARYKNETQVPQYSCPIQE